MCVCVCGGGGAGFSDPSIMETFLQPPTTAFGRHVTPAVAGSTRALSKGSAAPRREPLFHLLFDVVRGSNMADRLRPTDASSR